MKNLSFLKTTNYECKKVVENAEPTIQHSTLCLPEHRIPSKAIEMHKPMFAENKNCDNFINSIKIPSFVLVLGCNNLNRVPLT